MPSRPAIILIVTFWLASTGWLVWREVVPWLEAGEAPHYLIDLTDEVGANTINWTVLLKSEPVGQGISRVRRREDRTFDLTSEFKFNHFKVGDTLDISKMSSGYHVTRDGDLLDLWAKVQLKIEVLGSPELEVVGKVENELLHLKALVNGMEQQLVKLEPMALGKQRRVLNPMHLVSRLSGLHEGQRWLIPLLDPTSLGLTGQGAGIPRLEAEVHLASLAWQDKEVTCLRIDYREPGKQVKARTWVRARDGLVLQQEASHNKIQFTLVRNPSR